MLTQVEEIAVCLLLVISGVFGLVGSFGLVKLDQTMKRLHAPTKATTVGVGMALIASVIYYWLSDQMLSWHELLITAFLFVTAPITALFLSKAHIHRAEPPQAMPPTGTGRPWATLDPEPAPLDRP